MIKTKKIEEYDYFFENIDELLEFIKEELFKKRFIKLKVTDSIENRYIGELHGKHLVIDKAVYDANQIQIDEALKEYGEKRRNRIIETLDNNEEMHYLDIDEFTYSEDFAKKLIEYDPSLIYTVYIYNATVSEEVLSLLLENNIEVHINQGLKKIEIQEPNYEFSRCDIDGIKTKCQSGFQYESLIRASDDEIKIVMTLPEIHIYNRLEKYISRRFMDNKMNETNFKYLEKVFDIVSRFRKLGYNGIIDIESKSIFDFTKTRFRYSNLQNCKINNLFGPEIIMIIKNLADQHSDFFKDNKIPIEDKIRKAIAIASAQLLSIIGNQNISNLDDREILERRQVTDVDVNELFENRQYADLFSSMIHISQQYADIDDSEINRVFLERYIKEDFIYDFFRFQGIQTIKHIGENRITSYFIYDSSKQKFIEFIPSIYIGVVKHYYERTKDKEATDDQAIIKDCLEIANLIPDVIEKEDTSFQIFLSCTTGEELYNVIVEELKEYISDSINYEKEYAEKRGLFTNMSEEYITSVNKNTKFVTTFECVRQYYYDLRDSILSISPTYEDDKEMLPDIESTLRYKHPSDENNQLLQEKTEKCYLSLRNLCDKFIEAKRRICYRSSKIIDGRDRFQISPLQAVTNALQKTSKDKVEEADLIRETGEDKNIGEESYDQS